MAVAKTAKPEGLIYNGHPLRRKDNLIYYGTMAEKYIIQMQILETKKEKDLDVATKVAVQLQLTRSVPSAVWKRRPKKTAYTPPWMWPPFGWTGLWPANNHCTDSSTTVTKERTENEFVRF